jgi:hypothetical protein
VQGITRIADWEKEVTEQKEKLKQLETDLKKDVLTFGERVEKENEQKIARKRLEEAQLTLRNNRFAGFLAEILANERAKGRPGLASYAAQNTPIGQKRIIRPIDILNDAFDPNGAFEAIGFYPGELTACPAQLLNLRPHKEPKPRPVSKTDGKNH